MSDTISQDDINALLTSALWTNIKGVNKDTTTDDLNNPDRTIKIFPDLNTK